MSEIDTSSWFNIDISVKDISAPFALIKRKYLIDGFKPASSFFSVASIQFVAKAGNMISNLSNYSKVG
jgi:hypothetical protein